MEWWMTKWEFCWRFRILSLTKTDFESTSVVHGGRNFWKDGTAFQKEFIEGILKFPEPQTAGEVPERFKSEIIADFKKVSFPFRWKSWTLANDHTLYFQRMKEFFASDVTLSYSKEKSHSCLSAEDTESGVLSLKLHFKSAKLKSHAKSWATSIFDWNLYWLIVQVELHWENLNNNWMAG